MLIQMTSLKKGIVGLRRRMRPWLMARCCAAVCLLTFVCHCFLLQHLTTDTPSNSMQQFHWIKTRNLRDYIHPGKWTATIDQPGICYKQDYLSTAQASDMSISLTKNTQHPPVFLLVIVHSAPDNRDARDAIRNTWGGYLVQRQHPTTKLVFLLGRTPALQVQTSLEEEADHHGDIVQEDLWDAYVNLTLKSVFMLKWMKERCPDATYVLKTDDDMFIQPDNLLSFLTSHQKSLQRQNVERTSPSAKARLEEQPSSYIPEYILAGFRYVNNMPIRDTSSKWYMPESLYSDKFFPSFLSGTAYVFSGSLVPQLYSAALDTPFINLEDVFLTGLVAGDKLELDLIHHPGFHRNKPLVGHPCIYHNCVTAHMFNPKQLRDTWRKVRRIQDYNCDGVWARFLNYLYTWTA